MRFPQARRPGTRWSRFARWLGLDRNPLRRRTDRIEAAIRLATMLLIVVAVPLVCIVVGQLTDHLAQRQAHAQVTAERQVTAVLLQGVPPASTPDPYSSVQMAMVPARWQLPGQPARTGQVLAQVGARAGSTETIWVNDAGALATPPGTGVVDAAICVAVVNTCMAAGLLLVAVNALARRVLNRRRMSEWDAAWRATGPRWSRRT
jgi:hypothetical protein